MKKKKPEKEGNSERWLLTYSDLITLLMIFFIVLYAMGNTDAAKYKALSQGLNQAMGDGKSSKSGESGSGSGSGSGKNIIGTSDGVISVADSNWKPTDTNIVEQTSEETKLEDMQNKIDGYIKNSGLNGSVTTEIEDKGLVIRIKDALFFDSGKADIKSDYAGKLTEIGNILNNVDNYIVVEGNTDNVPMHTSQFSDNIDLASGRANNVMRILINNSKIGPDRISSRSNGEFRPIASNATAEGRAKNRRVEIFILNSKFNAVEGK